MASLATIREWSENAWDMAIETAGPEYAGGSEERQAEAEEAAESCLASYDAAIECCEARGEQWREHALAHLNDARTLEAEWGDSSHADMALEELQESEEG